MTSAFARLAENLGALRTANLVRTLEVGAAAQGPIRQFNHRQFINFCSNDYLGLANHPALKAALVQGVEKFGVGAGAAALLSGYSEAHHVLEVELANYLGYERALLFSSGYLANLGVIGGLVGRHDCVFHDRLNHASLIDAICLAGAKHVRYRHADPLELADRLADRAHPAWIVTDGVFSMDGDLAPLPQLAELAASHDAVLICDDAHGFGVLGNGAGTAASFGLNPCAVPIQTVTFGKALGTVGAAVLGPAVVIETLIQSARTFIYDTALPPALAWTTSCALRLATRESSLRAQLFANIKLFKAGLHSVGLPVPTSNTPIQPFVVGESNAALAAAVALRERGLYVRAVRPPTVPIGTARLRICLSAAHTAQQIEQLVDGLQAIRFLFPEASRA